MRTGLALGSNLGDRTGNLRSALKELTKAHRKNAELLASSIYMTTPVDCPPESELFFNAVVEIDAELDPVELLDVTQQIERDLGRPENRERNAPRTIDIDLLYWGGRRIDSDRLKLPHPRIRERLFVLYPLAEIRPDLILPGFEKPVSDCLTSFSGDETVPEIVSDFRLV